MIKTVDVTSKSVKSMVREELRDPDFKEAFGQDQQKLVLVKKIIAYRIKHRLSQGQLAQKLGISQQHVSKIENGDFSNLATLSEILPFIGYRMKITLVPLVRKGKIRVEKASVAR